MFRTLKDLFNALLAPSDDGAGPAASAHRLQLATAVLLVEVMRADDHCSAAERAAAIGALRDRFDLAEDEVARLFELAEATSRDAPDLYGFTSQLNKAFGPEDKLRMVEALWQVAFADGHLSHYENQLMLKLGDLLYIARGDFVAAKQRARAAVSPAAR